MVCNYIVIGCESTGSELSSFNIKLCICLKYTIMLVFSFNFSLASMIRQLMKKTPEPYKSVFSCTRISKNDELFMDLVSYKFRFPFRPQPASKPARLVVDVKSSIALMFGPTPQSTCFNHQVMFIGRKIKLKKFSK